MWKANCLIVIIASCVGMGLDASVAYASSEADSSSYEQDSSSSSELSWPPHNNNCYDHEVCEYVSLCGNEYCARENCDGCSTIPFIPIAGCVCPKGSLRLLVNGTKPGKCAIAKSPECECQAKLTDKNECKKFLPHKPCICCEDEECSTLSNSCGDLCSTMNYNDCGSNALSNQRGPHCICKPGYKRLRCGKCVDLKSHECQSEAIKSLDRCKDVELRVPQPCRCNYFYESPK